MTPKDSTYQCKLTTTHNTGELQPKEMSKPMEQYHTNKGTEQNEALAQPVRQRSSSNNNRIT